MRTDGSRNRAAILDAAREMVSEPGELHLSAVAKKAGVGQGTLYRHFASRDDLLAALYTDEIDDLVDAAESLVAAHAPDEALRRWFERLAAYARVKVGIIEVVEASVWADMSSTTHDKLGRALTTLLAAGVESGQVRRDVDPRDVILLSWFLAHVGADEWRDRVPRLLDVLLDGLRTRER
ncbi:TetR family transcriptional regulator [Microlunatus endophyticus]|uniref:TetR family transcriptional regulator n=1 Tax=Microlunatus endophyticus TaxID=1716077 RepID=A0A917SGP5_9ACTN|nr:TetR/AcrR family transcriptional regulator [Microlunatus endophyticus]GGL81497.1 TetR family transcriptional regulator [Microlunatus endophyticus]